MDNLLWTLKVQETFPVTLSLPEWFTGTTKCSPHDFPVFNPKTEFLSTCLLVAADGLVSLMAILPLLFESYRLSKHERGKCTALGRISFIFALACPVLRLTAFMADGSQPVPAEWVAILGGAAAALLHYAQEGRVRVASSELLVYWLGICLTSVGLAVDALLRHQGNAYLLVLTAAFGLIAFALELSVDRNGGVVAFDTVNAFDKISLSFMTPLLQKGAETRLTREDFPQPVQGLNSVNTHAKLAAELERYPDSSKYRVILSVMYVLRWKMVGMVIADILSEAFTFMRPLALAYFLRSLQNYYYFDDPIFPAAYYAVLVGVLPLFSAAFQNVLSLINAYAYIVSRTSLMGMIYRKALRLSPKSRETFDAAKIMNLISVDTDMIESAIGLAPTLVSAPIALVLSTMQLYMFIGNTMFAAVPLYLLFVPFSGFISKMMYNYFPVIMKVKDERNKATSNAFRNIKSLKLYAWELPFFKKISDIRSGEMDMQARMQKWFASMSAIWSMMGDFVAAAVFITYLYFQQGELRPDVVFAVLALLAYVTMPFMALPMAVTSIGKAMAGQTRINELLVQDEQDYKNMLRLPASSDFHDKSVEFDDVTVSWNGEDTDDKIALRNITTDASPGELVCITGRVGSGKTAFLKTLCGELKILDGLLTLRGTLAYCAQEAWLQNKTVKENILFGRKYDENYYHEVLEACDLSKDIAQLPEKDNTDVGERGISLSGGQKARVSLARALYSRADILVLDDVLSAVDEHVSAHLIDRVLGKDGLVASKTIILATNNVRVLSHASKIIALQDKKIVEQGTLQEVLDNKDKSAIFRLIKEFGTGGDIENITIEDRKEHVARSGTRTRRTSISDEQPTLQKSQDDEEQGAEAVSVSIFKRYFDSAGRWTLIGSFLFMIFSVLVMNSVNVWLGELSNKNFTNLSDAKFYVIVYLLLTATASLTIFITVVWFMGTVAIRVSKVLHDEMLESLMHAPMSLFDSTPLGKIVNRFTTDMQNLDNTLPTYLYYFVRSILNSLVMILLVLIGAPIVILVVLPLAFLSNYYRKLYVPASRQLSRMSSAANSPILSHIEESVKGAAIIRSFDSTQQFIETYDYRTDYWIDCTFLKMNARRWLAWRVQGMTTVLGLATALAMVVLVYHRSLSVGFVGVVLQSSLRLGIMVQQVIFFWADLEVAGVALERILEYIDTPREAPYEIAETAPAGDWPKNGAVAYDNFSARYREQGPDVLKNISFSINSQEKIGIVGRTGSGKSTLTLTLFRLLEGSGGHVEVDSVDTSKIGLTDLRSKLSIIPQDAQIFEGTLRQNLDPLGLVDDERLWQVLDLCHLKDHFSKLGSGLDTALVDGGDNLSRGQSQLICLGRALVHEAKILVLDEATASVDVETDAIVQQTIRSQFKDRTIITIAHRLNTIMDSDRIMVLDKGQLVEFDTPANLLASKGYFWSLNNTHENDVDEAAEEAPTLEATKTPQETEVTKEAPKETLKKDSEPSAEAPQEPKAASTEPEVELPSAAPTKTSTPEADTGTTVEEVVESDTSKTSKNSKKSKSKKSKSKSKKKTAKK